MQKTVDVPQVRFLDRAVDVPVVMQRQVPQEQIQEHLGEETDVLVSRVTEKITEVVKDMPREHVQGNTVEQSVEVTDPLIQEETVEVIPLTQQNQTPGRVRDEIAEEKDDDEESYEQFGKRLKLGIHKSFTDRAEVAKLLRNNTSKSVDEQTNFKGDIGRMKEGQHDIYYITGESIAVVFSSSFQEYWRKKGYEVLYMADPVDQFAVQQLKEFDGKTVKFTPEDRFDLGDHDEKNKFEALKAQFKPLTKLREIVSDGIVELPCVPTTSEYGWSAKMERIAQ